MGLNLGDSLKYFFTMNDYNCYFMAQLQENIKISKVDYIYWFYLSIVNKFHWIFNLNILLKVYQDFLAVSQKINFLKLMSRNLFKKEKHTKPQFSQVWQTIDL